MFYSEMMTIFNEMDLSISYLLCYSIKIHPRSIKIFEK